MIRAKRWFFYISHRFLLIGSVIKFRGATGCFKSQFQDIFHAAAPQISGGPNANRTYQHPNPEKTDEQIKEAEALIAAGKPRQLMLIPAWWWVVSARTFMDRLTNAPDLVENAKRIKCPVLFIRGDQEPKDNYPAERFSDNCAGLCEVAIIPNCDHFYVGAEDRVAKTVTDWLLRTLGDTA